MPLIHTLERIKSLILFILISFHYYLPLDYVLKTHRPCKRLRCDITGMKYAIKPKIISNTSHCILSYFPVNYIQRSFHILFDITELTIQWIHPIVFNCEIPLYQKNQYGTLDTSSCTTYSIYVVKLYFVTPSVILYNNFLWHILKVLKSF